MHDFKQARMFRLAIRDVLDFGSTMLLVRMLTASGARYIV
jgi:hypothetical protein